MVSASPEALIVPLARHLSMAGMATGCSDPRLVTDEHPLRLTTPNGKGPEKLRRRGQHLGALPPPRQLKASGVSRGNRELLQANGRPHSRSFTATPSTDRQTGAGRWLIPAAAVALLRMAGVGLSRLDPTVRLQLSQACIPLLE